MAKLAAAAARQASLLSRLSSPKSPAQAAALIHRRGLAGAADHHGPPRINFWQDPMSPSKWKEEHFVIVSLSGWGVLIYGGYKFFTGGKSKEEVLLDIFFPTVSILYFTVISSFAIRKLEILQLFSWNGVFAPFIQLFYRLSSFYNVGPFYK
ncbi:hypothetical protein OIU74_024578 [Salix koriyanagi]|uniref:Uncharacterized protein n=1 Tax=Salix koriyanagi TaxID=2511006 RepID=A0A9Q0WA28_9ROSI|nr:hypothetical protein OIU74_024578 [Salix koriyanagi]